jgi:carbamoyl-phosphate synthase large subunit
LDPVGVHTGDSIVVAPVQTLTDIELQMLRTASINIIKELKIEGGCNVQFALDPFSLKYGVIEVNPRVSRSSALASKATGYPIARISTLLSIGYTLDEIQNPINKNVSALYEPTLDYIAVKIAKFPFEKFPNSPNILTTQMQATGEVLGLGACFEEALLKAYDSLGNKDELFDFTSFNKNTNYITPASNRLNNIFKALAHGISVQKIYLATKIDKFFLNKINNIIKISKNLKLLNKDNLLLAKKYGISDKSIAYITKNNITHIKNMRNKFAIIPNFKKIDACGAEFACDSNYFYSSYSGFDENVDKTKKKKVLIVGSGPIKIGQGIEFDYCCVHAI